MKSAKLEMEIPLITNPEKVKVPTDNNNTTTLWAFEWQNTAASESTLGHFGHEGLQQLLRPDSLTSHCRTLQPKHPCHHVAVSLYDIIEQHSLSVL